MKTFIALGFFIIFLVCVQFASAQTVDEVIDKYMAARGGKEKLNSIKSIYMEGSREMMGNEVAVKITKVQGKLSRTEFEMGATNGFNLITEKEAWNFFPMRSQDPQKLADSLVPMMQTELDIAGPLVDYITKGHKAELEGKENVGDISCYKIKLTTKAGKKITYWIQTDNYLLLQSAGGGGVMMGRRRDNAEGGTPPPGEKLKTGKMFIMYKDYKAVDGILFPHAIEIRTEGSELQGGGTTFDKIELNKSVDEKLYKPE
jgi:hypothetical protein